MLDALGVRYGKTYRNGSAEMDRYVKAEHVRSTLGFDARRTLDFIAVDLWGATYGKPEDRGPYIHGHEIKVSRSDWLVELRDPGKAAAFSRYTHYFWLVVSDRNIVRPGELPAGWGLMVRYGASTRVLTAAVKTVPEVMPLTMHGALLRAAVKTGRRTTAADSA